MQKSQFTYGVMLPRELRDRFMSPDRKSMTAILPIVAINIAVQKNPTGIGTGTIITNPRDDDDSYAGLAFRGYLSWARGEVELVGRELEYYDVFSVNLRRAERMLALLRKIRNAEARLPAIPSCLGQYIALLGPAVGIKYAVTAEDDATERRNYYPEGWYRIRPIREAQVYLQNLVAGVREKYLPTVEAAVHSGIVN